MNKDEDEAQIAERAAEWLVRLDSIPAEEHAEFFEWLMRSSAHVRAFEAAMRLRLTLVHHKHIGEAIERARGNASRDTSRRWPLFALATLVTIAAVIPWAWKFASIPSDAITTKPGEWRHETLADGTVLLAAPRTHLHIEFSSGCRTIQLEKGAAMFHVAQDTGRPFQVVSDVGTARVVGTIFTVSRDVPTTFRVDVKEGLVTVARDTDACDPPENADPPSQSVTLRAGEQVIVSAASALAPRKVDIEMTTAWTQRLLKFSNHTVEQAVNEFNRLNEEQIQVLDPTLRREVLSGAFDAADPRAFAAYLTMRGEFVVIDDNAGHLLIVPKAPAAAIR